MKDLKFNEFLNRADDFIINVAMGGEPYRIKAQAGNAILISEKEFNRLMDSADKVRFSVEEK